ncbi:MAG TPA: 2-phosphosulfolactate phosphatase [Lacipirellulaceae bacterium]|jgi:2-phosphosulfolactate phosphatase|nr:2-phosphosulfolactate phosphatase [Lacipirellulaceae bacterium]
MRVEELNVYKLPIQVAAEDLADSAVIVIDLLRATTTICYALAAGAKEVVPFRGIEEAREAARAAGREHVILAGERKGLLIEGFDLGNSPAEFTAERIARKQVLLTTTNGTQALYHARLARRIIAGAIVNLSAIVASVKDEPKVAIVCAGTDGQETQEDILTAGAIVHLLRHTPVSGDLRPNDAAALAENEWSLMQQKAKSAKRDLREELAIALRDTRGGRNCIEVGNGDDLPDCADIDRFKIVPELDVAKWRITTR